MRRNMQYKLLTPGPLTTTDTVKQEMMVDHCTWDDDYKQVTQKIRSGRACRRIAGGIYDGTDAGKRNLWC